MIDLSGVSGMFTFEEYYRSVYKRLPNNSRVFEIGVYEGRSTFFFADLIRSGGKSVEFHCCDIFEPMVNNHQRFAYAPDYYDRFRNHMARLNLGDYIKVHKGSSAEVLATFPDKYFDYIYIDGNHDCEPVFADVSTGLKKLRVGGILAGHDQSWLSVQCGLSKAKILSWRVFDGDVWEAKLAWLN